MNPQPGGQVRLEEEPLQSGSPTGTVRVRLGRQIKESDALRRRTLPLAVLASVVGTVLASACGTGRTGALLSAALGPLITALFTTSGRAKARSAGIVLVTVVALAVTVTGFTVPEFVRGGKSLVADREGTFVPTEDSGGSTPSPLPSPPPVTPTTPLPARTGPAIATSPTTIGCADTPVNGAGACPSLDVRSVGTADLQVTGVEVEGGTEFVPTMNCPAPLTPPDGSCSVSVEFHPTAAGPRQAVLVVHQNLPGPATRVPLEGTGVATDGGSPAPTASAGAVNP
jgi:hypothetical protein